MFSKLILIFIITTSIKTSVIQSFVQIKKAQIDGFTKQVLGKKINVYLGIPYAQPPTGDNRFQKPQAVELTGRIDATKWPGPCWQPDGPEFFNFENRNYSEDCLNLNIWAPKSKKLKPVLVWIHGGGLTHGSSNDITYEGDVLAARANVIVVSINYRLNVFGFLFADSDELPGNVGLYDQQLAMKWIRDNIKYFCGDPEKVTLIGESAGGWSTSAHFLSPGSRNLFNNGIVLSSSVLDKILAKSRQEAKQLSLSFAKSLGCANSSAKEFNQKAIECLKKIEPKQFYAKEKHFGSVVWGTEFLPDNPIKMLKSNDFKTKSQLLIGTVENEAISEFNSVLDESEIESPDFSKEDARKVIENNKILSKYNTSEIFKHYIATIPDDDKDALRKATTMAYGDVTITCPTIDFGKLIFENGKKNQVFEYRYTYNHRMEVLKELNISSYELCKKFKGACHTYDLVSLFGWPLKRPDKFSKREKELSKRMIETVASFSRFGHPAKIKGVEWRAFYSVNGATAMPYYEFAKRDFPRGNFEWNLKEFECQVLFKKLLD